MLSFLKLIRIQNLLIIFLTQWLTYQCLIRHGVTHGDLDIKFIYLLAATVLIAAGGYLINDIYDVGADVINKGRSLVRDGKYSTPFYFTIYILFNITALVLGSMISRLFVLFFAVVAFLLFVYSAFLKKKAFTGNLLVAAILGFTVLILWFFEPGSNPVVILFFSIFSFLAGLLREIVKDIEDIEGDSKMQMNTLPIRSGINHAKKIAYIVSVILGISVAGFVFWLHEQVGYMVILYFVLLLVILLLITLNFKKAVTKIDFHRSSSYIKIYLLLGLLSMLFLQKI